MVAYDRVARRSERTQRGCLRWLGMVREHQPVVIVRGAGWVKLRRALWEIANGRRLGAREVLPPCQHDPERCIEPTHQGEPWRRGSGGRYRRWTNGDNRIAVGP